MRRRSAIRPARCSRARSIIAVSAARESDSTRWRSDDRGPRGKCKAAAMRGPIGLGARDAAGSAGAGGGVAPGAAGVGRVLCHALVAGAGLGAGFAAGAAAGAGLAGGASGAFARAARRRSARVSERVFCSVRGRRCAKRHSLPRRHRLAKKSLQTTVGVRCGASRRGLRGRGPGVLRQPPLSGGCCGCCFGGCCGCCFGGGGCCFDGCCFAGCWRCCCLAGGRCCGWGGVEAGKAATTAATICARSAAEMGPGLGSTPPRRRRSRISAREGDRGNRGSASLLLAGSAPKNRRGRGGARTSSRRARAGPAAQGETDFSST